MTFQPKDGTRTAVEPLTTLVSKVSNDEDTVQSMECGPCCGFEYGRNEPRLHFVQSPSWETGQKRIHDDNSLSTFPEIPSPYSPLPASLQSGEDWVQPSVELNSEKQPPTEVTMPISNACGSERLRSHPSSSVTTGNSAFNFFESSHQDDHLITSPAAELTHSNSRASSRTERSHVMPAIMFMKHSLQESHQTQYLLRQENESLVIECSKLQEELKRCEFHSHEINAEAQSKNDELRNDLNTLRESFQKLVQEKSIIQEESMQELEMMRIKHSKTYEHNQTLVHSIEKLESRNDELTKSLSELEHQRDTLSNELSCLQANLVNKEKQERLHKAEIENLEKEIRILENKNRLQTTDNGKKQKQLNDEYEKKLAGMVKEKESSNFEIIRLQAMLVEAKQEIKRLTKETQVLKQAEEIADSRQDELQTLKDANNTLERDVCVLKEKIRVDTDCHHRAASELQNDVALVRDQLSEHIQCVRNLEAELSNALVKNNEVSAELKSKIRDNSTLREEANRLQGELVQSRELTTELTSQVDELTNNLEALKKELYIALSNSEDTENVLATSESASLELQSKNSLLKKADVSPNTSHPNEGGTFIATAHEVACQTDSTQPVDGLLDDSVFGTFDQNPLAGRFTRVKDAVERATLIREYKQELSRVRHEYENEIKFITATHDHSLKQILHDAKLELLSRVQESKHRHQAEVEQKLAEVRLQHQQEIEKMKEDFNETMSSFEETMQETLSERTSLVSKVTELKMANEGLLHSHKELERQLSIARHRFKLEEKLKFDRKKWQKETNHLLASVQEQCNSIFRSTIREVQNEPSPRTVLIDEDLTNEKDFCATISVFGLERMDDNPAQECTDTLQSFKDFCGLQSPLQVNKTLDETEAILQNLLGDEIQM